MTNRRDRQHREHRPRSRACRVRRSGGRHTRPHHLQHRASRAIHLREVGALVVVAAAQRSSGPPPQGRDALDALAAVLVAARPSAARQLVRTRLLRREERAEFERPELRSRVGAGSGSELLCANESGGSSSRASRLPVDRAHQFVTDYANSYTSPVSDTFRRRSRRPPSFVEKSAPIANIVTAKVASPPMYGIDESTRNAAQPSKRCRYAFWVL